MNLRFTISTTPAAAAITYFLDTRFLLLQTSGLVLIGLATTWLVASSSPRALWLAGSMLLAAGGLLAAVAPLLGSWNSFRASVRDYDAAISDFRQAIGSAKSIWRVSPKGEPVIHGPWDDYAQTGARSYGTLPPGFFAKPMTEEFAYLSQDPDFSKSTPVDQRGYVQYLREGSTVVVQIPESTRKWGRGEWTGAPGVDFSANMTTEEMVRAFQDHGLRPRPTFSLVNAVRSHEERLFGGIVLAVVGLSGWVWRIRRKT